MHTRSKLLLAGLTAAIVLSAVVSTATASRLSTTERGFRAIWRVLRLTSGETVLECPVTLQGSFHSATIAKSRGVLIGAVTLASVRGQNAAGACTNGTATIRQESLPWHITYLRINGTLPRPTGLGILLIGAAFRIDPAGILPACEANTTVERPAAGLILIEPNGLVTGIEADPTFRIPLGGGFGCSFGEDGTFAGLGSVTRLTGGGNIRITLI